MTTVELAITDGTRAATRAALRDCAETWGPDTAIDVLLRDPAQLDALLLAVAGSLAVTLEPHKTDESANG